MIHTIENEQFKISSIPTGTFKLDGGAMFGVVPKALWTKQIPADELNRIEMGMRCLLIQSKKTQRNYLIDTGLGTKYDAKFKKIYDVRDVDDNLLKSLSKIGINPDQITDLIFTHLHFDHCGGAIKKTDDEKLEFVFPNATHWVHNEHWNTVLNPNKREIASFLPENINPLKECNHLAFTTNSFEFEPGLDILVMHGHTKGQQLPRIQFNDHTLIFAADLIPTAAHIPLAWVMGYDMNAEQTLSEKEFFLKKVSDHNWLLFLEHDASHELIQIEANGTKFKVSEFLTLNDLT